MNWLYIGIPIAIALIPVLEMIARKTETEVDDIVVKSLGDVLRLIMSFMTGKTLRGKVAKKLLKK